MRIYGYIKEVVEAWFKKDGYDVKITPNSNTYAGTTTFSLPPATSGTDTLVGAAATQTLTNKSISGATNTITNVPISTGVSGLGTGIADFLATPSSANLRAALTDETGTGAAVFATSPTIATPTLTDPTMTGQASAPTYAAGKMWYDTSDNTMRYYNDSTTDSVNIGQELNVKVRNTSGSTITPGQVLRVTGAVGGVPTVALAQANTFANSRVFAVATESISNNSNGYATVAGLIKNLSLNSFSDGDVLFLSASTPGALTATRPSAPNYAIVIGSVASNNNTTGRLIVTINPGRPLGLGSANQILGMNSGGTEQEYKTVQGTANEIEVTHAANSITLGIPNAPVLVEPVIDNFLDLNEESAPSTPASGKLRMYAKTDGKLYTKDDAGTETQVGAASGAGGVTLISNPSDATNWSETGTVFATPVTTTTSGDLPLSGATATAIQFVATNSGAEASHYNSYSVTTSAAMNGKLQVDFFMRPGTGFAANEWTVSVYQGSTRQTLDSDSSGVTYLRNNTGRVTVSFDAVASTAYTLRFARVSGSGTATLNICNVFLGWPFVSSVAPVGETQSVTMTGSWVSNTTYTAFETRIGSWARYDVKVTCSGAPTSTGLQLTLPSGRTIDTTKLLSTLAEGGNRIPFSVVSVNDTGVQGYTGSVYYASTTNVAVAIDDTASTYARVSPVTQAVPITFGNTDFVMVSFMVPIAEWAGSVSTGPAPAEEWAADDGSADVFGPSGALVPNVAASTGTTTRVFTFQYPQQVTQSPNLEYYNGNGWANASDLYPFQGGNNSNANNFYGVRGYWSSSTQYTVEFGNQGTRVNASNADAGSSSWATRFSAGDRFRVSKCNRASLPYANASADASGLYPAKSSLARIRLHTLTGYGSTNTAVLRYTTTVVNTGSGITYADSSTAGASFTVTEAGIYSFTMSASLSASGNFGFSLNSSQLTTNIVLITAADRLISQYTPAADVTVAVSWTGYLAVGDVVRPHGDGITIGAAPGRAALTCQRIS